MNSDKSKSKEAHWFKIVEQWQMSGATQSAFSRDHDLELSVFRYWINRYKKAQQPSMASFIPVHTKSSDVAVSSERTLILQLPHGMTLTIPL